MTPVLSALMTSPEDITEESMAGLERFVVLLYDRTSSLTKVNEARQQLFSKRSRELDSIPPTRAAFDQHVRRAVLQGGHVWGQSFLRQQVLPSPSTWGWQLDTGLHIGHPSHKPRTLVTNSSVVDVKFHVAAGVNV
jgi:hypothetical protein